MKVITAIGNPIINEKLREHNEYEVIGKDIQYEEGIIEILEEIKDIDLLIISNNLPEEYEFNILINKIKTLKESIEIIVFLKEKNQDLENFLNSKNIYKIFYLNKMDEYISCLNITNYKEKAIKDIDEIKQLMNNNFIGKMSKNCSNSAEDAYNKKIIIKNKSIHKAKKSAEIIVVSGVSGSGKSIIATILSKYIEQKNKKVLLIDFDLFSSSINIILAINYLFEETYDIKDCIINVNKNFDVITSLNHFFKNLSESEINSEFIKLLNEIKYEYDYIIIDTSVNSNYNILKTLLLNATKILFLVEPNISEIRKGEALLEIYLHDFYVLSKKIKIVFNKTNRYKIAKSVLEEMFFNYEIVGDIEYDERFNLIINRGLNHIFLKREFEKIFENIK